MSTLKYRKDIDGLRAVAVLTVIFYHMNVPPFYAGFLGVDVFFVISGFLITQILVEKIDNKSFSLLDFYIRRSRRLFPALFLVVLVTLLISFSIMTPREFDELAKTSVASVSFVSNIYFWKSADYFNPVSELNPLLHTWSLAVEEQFYLIYPFLLLLLSLYLKVFRGFVILLCVLVSFAIAHYGSINHPSAAFYFLPTRFWELGVGAILALQISAKHNLFEVIRNKFWILPDLGLLLIIFSLIYFNSETPTPSISTLIPVLGTVLVLIANNSRSFTTRMLSSKPVVFVGVISYSLYLWHQPIVVFYKLQISEIDGLMNTFVLILLIFVISWLSYKLFESPLRRSKNISTKKFFLVLGTLLLPIVAIAVYGVATNGNREAWLAKNSDKMEILLAIEQRTKGSKQLNEDACFFNINGPKDFPELSVLEGCQSRFGKGLILIGDSHAADLYRGLFKARQHDDLMPPQFVVGFVRSSCRIVGGLESCPHMYADDFLAESSEFFNGLIYHQAGFYFLNKNSGITGRMMFSRIGDNDPINVDEFIVKRDDLDIVQQRLLELSSNYGVKIKVITPRIEPHISERYILDNGCDATYSLRPGMSALFGQLSHEIETRFQRVGIDTFNTTKAIPMLNNEDFINCPSLLWRDGDHWSNEGELYFIKKLLDKGAFQFTNE